MQNLRITRQHLTISAAVVACLALSACGAITEKVTEEGTERIIESESGENVELDFDNGDGSFSVQSEDGSFSVNEDGEFVVTDADGSVFAGTSTDDGLVVTDANGEEVVNVSGDADGGELTIQSEGEGDAVYRVVTEIPAEWPTDVPRPEDLAVEAGSYTSADAMTIMTVVGTPDNGDAAEYADTYSSALAAAGLTESGRFDSSADGNQNVQRTYESDAWTVSIIGVVDASANTVSISVSSNR